MVSKPLDSSTYVELNLKECGREICIPDKVFEFTSKTYFLLHYVVSGKGIFVSNGETYHLHHGDIFYIAPNTHPKYTPDHNEPWTYLWLGFDGSNAPLLLSLAGLDENHPILHDSDHRFKEYFDNIYNEYINKGYFDLVCLGQAYCFFGQLDESQKMISGGLTSAEGHILAAKDFIFNNYQYHITVDEIAQNVGVTPNYLANIFAKFEKSSPKKFLTEVRMKNAAVFLRTGIYRVHEVGQKVGFSNQLHFSNEFKKFFGVSPLNYMKGNSKV
jgi:AraC-like DNA-binding protein